MTKVIDFYFFNSIIVLVDFIEELYMYTNTHNIEIIYFNLNKIDGLYIVKNSRKIILVNSNIKNILKEECIIRTQLTHYKE